MSKYVLWDFDGTLGWRIDGLHGKAWSSSMLEAIVRKDPGSVITVDDIAPHLGAGFPWQEPEKDYLHLTGPGKWWEHIRRVMADIYIRFDYSEQEARELAAVAQERFVDLSTWELFPDARPVLEELKRAGWNHLIVSNHVPELKKIASHLGLDPYVEAVINSAEVGFEKPHPGIFRAALERIGKADDIWMVGDNIVADVIGGEQAGLKAILVRNKDPRAKLQFDDLYGVRHFMLERGL